MNMMTVRNKLDRTVCFNVIYIVFIKQSYLICSQETIISTAGWSKDRDLNISCCAFLRPVLIFSLPFKIFPPVSF